VRVWKLKRVGRCARAIVLLCLLALPAAGARTDLQVGVAGHAFEHLGGIGDQAAAAAASGANIIYGAGELGSMGYHGLPTPEELKAARERTRNYIRAARKDGIRLVIGYVCATSIVKLEGFDRNWPPGLRKAFNTSPAHWRQQDRHGNPLPSWYGGDYQPACMNNPDWRAYERFIVQQELQAGCDGIFFDNPTVHAAGCYCEFCMRNFTRFLLEEGTIEKSTAAANSLAENRELTEKYPIEFLRFRATIARDFLDEMRRYARDVKHGALLTANNSLNSPQVLYSQCRTHGYDIFEMSKAEDFVVVEDESSQPRMLADGRVIEYTPTYKQLHAICHGKPVVAVTIAQGDYHTPPELVRLAEAEAAANAASYLSWPTWPEAQRARMVAGVRPEAEFLRRHAVLLNDTRVRRDVVLFLPFRKWVVTGTCQASSIAAELARANIQFEVVAENTFSPAALRGAKVLVAGAESDFEPGEVAVVQRFAGAGGALVTANHPEWLALVRQSVGKASVSVSAPVIRAIVRDQDGRTMVHLLNLNVQRLSSFQDKVTPAKEVRVEVTVPSRTVRSVTALTADDAATKGKLEFTTESGKEQSQVKFVLPEVEVATIVVVE
jgi:hypothetical protein